MSLDGRLESYRVWIALARFKTRYPAQRNLTYGSAQTDSVMYGGKSVPLATMIDLRRRVALNKRTTKKEEQ